jgi:hypothetical protein
VCRCLAQVVVEILFALFTFCRDVYASSRRFMRRAHPEEVEKYKKEIDRNIRMHAPPGARARGSAHMCTGDQGAPAAAYRMGRAMGGDMHMWLVCSRHLGS